MKYFKISVRLVLIMNSMFLLAGCATHVATDIQIDSVQIVEQSNVHKYIDVGGRNGYFIERGSPSFIVLKISTGFDFLEYIDNPGKSLYVESWFCDLPNTEFNITLTDLYFRKRPVQSYVAEKSQLPKDSKEDRLYYTIVAFTESPPNVSKEHRYNLILNPRDICIQIKGGDMLSTYSSGRMILKGSQIRSVFKSETSAN